MAIKTVMLVDDEEDIRTVAELALSELGGWRVVLVETGKRAVSTIRAERPDVVLLDAMMPELDGLATFDQIKSDPEAAAIPVIFMTAKVQPSEVQRYLEAGARGVIGKPFDPMTLPDEIRRIVDGRG